MGFLGRVAWDERFWYAFVPFLTCIGSIRGGFRVPFVEWLGFHSLMHDPPLPPIGNGVFGLLFVNGVVDPFGWGIFS